MSKIFTLVLMILAVVSTFCLHEQQANAFSNTGQHDQIPISYAYHIVNVYPHDQGAFTEGLLYNNGLLYESIGGYGQSSLRQVELKTGIPLKSLELDKSYFGEGITIWQNRLILLTWQEQVGFVYDPETFEKINNFYYSTKGWGLTDDGQRLIMSDGTDTLHFLDPVTFNEVGNLRVRDRETPVEDLNELEYVNGEIFANVSPNRIARISPATGRVIGWLDLSELYDQVLSESSEGDPPLDLTSIAYDEQKNRLFVTGKFWPRLFEIELVHNSEVSKEKLSLKT